MGQRLSAESLLDIARETISAIRYPSIAIVGECGGGALRTVEASAPTLGFAGMIIVAARTSPEAAAAETGSEIVLSYSGRGKRDTVTIIGKVWPVPTDEWEGSSCIGGSVMARQSGLAAENHRLLLLRPERIEVSRLRSGATAAMGRRGSGVLRRAKTGNWQVTWSDTHQRDPVQDAHTTTPPGTGGRDPQSACQYLLDVRSEEKFGSVAGAGVVRRSAPRAKTGPE